MSITNRTSKPENIVHNRFADILTTNVSLDSENELIKLKNILSQLSQSAAEGSSCLELKNDQVALLSNNAGKLTWLNQTEPKTSVVLLKNKRLYLNKYHHAERSIEDKLEEFAGMTHIVNETAVKTKLDPLRHMNEDAKNVILTCLKQNLSVITGGPGTGKTTIVVRVLALLIEQFINDKHENPNIEVLAPTGKASARVKESIVRDRSFWLDNLSGFSKSTIEQIPDVAQTVHKFLSINPTTSKSKYVRGKTSNVNILIVDEASMLDVVLMKQLLEALKPSTHLILLGDPYQLASVDAGNVLAQIVSASKHEDNTWLAKCCTQLTISYRFKSDSSIGQLAQATNKEDSETAINVLKDDNFPDAILAEIDSAHDIAIKGYQHYKKLIQQSKKTLKSSGSLSDKDKQNIFDEYDKWQVFSPYREGKFGVKGLNQEIEKSLALSNGDTDIDGYYFGKPIIITSNDHALKLSNGDIGICLDEQAHTICFPTTDENGQPSFKDIPIRILPEHDLVYAMTVHKSQGSEYAACLLVVPTPNENQKALLTREIFYTAITRSRKVFTIAAGISEIEIMVKTKTKRMSGLLE